MMYAVGSSKSPARCEILRKAGVLIFSWDCRTLLAAYRMTDVTADDDHEDYASARGALGQKVSEEYMTYA